MPNPVDLTGQRWGKLVAVAKAPDVFSASGKKRSAAWLCRCDCGREEVFPTRRLPYCPSNIGRKDAAYSCSHCRHQRTCAVCGKVFESVLFRATCSERCAVLQRRSNEMQHYHRQVAKDPDYNKKIRAARNARAVEDPSYAEHLRAQRREQDRRKDQRIHADPERLAHYNAKARERYHRNRAENIAKKKIRHQARIEAMTEAEYLAWLQRRRAAFNRYAQNARSTPEGRERYREYMREFRAQQALRKLFVIGQELKKRGNES